MSELKMGDKEVLDIFRAVTERERLNWWQRQKIHLYIWHSLLERAAIDEETRAGESKKKNIAKAWLDEHSDEHANLQEIVSAIDALVVRPERM